MALLTAGLIIEAVSLIGEAEKLRDYWDDNGFDFHLAVKQDGRVAVSTKHWGRVHYIVTELDVESLWDKVMSVAESCGRSLVKSSQGTYVYIPKLNKEQAQRFFDKMKVALGYKIERKFEFEWSIDDAVLPDMLVTKSRDLLVELAKQVEE